jgi:hypothetical protein
MRKTGERRVNEVSRPWELGMMQVAPVTRRRLALERDFEANRFAKDCQAKGYAEVLPLAHARVRTEAETMAMRAALDEGLEQGEQRSRKEVAA